MQNKIIIRHLISMKTIFDRIASRFPEYETESDMEGEEGLILTPFRNFSFCVSVNVDPRFSLEYVSVDIAYKRIEAGYETSIYIRDENEAAVNIVTDVIHKAVGGSLEIENGDALKQLPPCEVDAAEEYNRIIAIALKDVNLRLQGSLLASIAPSLVQKCYETLHEEMRPDA